MKKFLSMLLVVILVVSLAACGQSNTPSPTPTNTQQPTGTGGTGESVTIKFANYAVLEEAHTEFWEKIKTNFEKDNPNIKIEWVSAPYGEIMQQVINMAGGGERVDMIFGELDWIPGFADSGLIAPVTDILTEEYMADFYPDIMEAFKDDGEIYAVPLYISPYVLYYNKDLFTKAGLDPNKPPKTYDEMLVMAEKLSQLKTEDGNKVYAFGQTTASVPISGVSLTSMIFNFGGQVLDDQGRLSVDNQGFKDAINMLKLLDDKGYNPQNAKLKDLRNLFALGQLAMYYDQSHGFAGVKPINPEAENFAATAKPLAGGNGIGQTMISSHCMFLVDNGQAKNEAVSKLVEYIITTENLSERMSNVTLAYPAKKAMANAVSGSTILQGALGTTDNIKTQVFVPENNNLNLELTTLAQAVTVGNEDVDKAIETFKQAAKQFTN
ncbi:MAG: ABC transporter substrate-binding protein [Bacillota bacterium]|jgi:multiple sugar transport system substrate-binding protein